MNGIQYFLCLDQGSTKTHALVGDSQGRIYGMHQSLGACHALHGMDLAMSYIKEAALGALTQANLSMGQIESLHIGLTGADWKHEYEMLEKEISQRLTVNKVVVYNDCIIAMRGGIPQSHGAILCAGSGLNAAVKSQDGREIVYGYYVAPEDQGGGALGNIVFNMACQSHMGLVRETSLLPALLDYFQKEDMDTLVEHVFSGDILNGPIKDLAPIIFQEADKGDPLSKDILKDFGSRWGRYITTAVKRLGIKEKNFHIVLSGSVFKSKNRILLDSIYQSIEEVLDEPVFIAAQYEPVVGAWLLALDQQYQKEIPPVIQQIILEESQRMGMIRNVSL